MMGFLLVAICIEIAAIFFFVRSRMLYIRKHPDWSLRLLSAGFFQIAAMIAFAIYLQN